MAGSGAGPSRRSHTKSRKGCRTCKKRHIRCDETFPQCKNCTKHQVRCDYMESVGSDNESQHSPESSTLSFSPTTENRIEQWQQSGSFPYPELHVFPPPPIHEYSKNELRLMHHLTSISDDLRVKGTANLSIWAQKVPKFLSLAATYPYVMHALLSFSANNLAFSRHSSETRNLQIQHGTIALRGLHDAIGSFSHANADAVLAASLLLLWQATDWLSWSSLRGGIQSVLASMQSWKHDSIFADYIHEEDLFESSYRAHRRTNSVDPVERNAILQNNINALQRLQISMIGNETESYWIEQLLDYVQRLQVLPPAQTSEEQFNLVYILRKWLFWVPVQLLQRQENQGSAMLTIAHFYSVAINLEPLFPDLGTSFCARAALGPLENILGFTDALQSQFAMSQSTMEIGLLMQFPQQSAIHFRNRIMLGIPSPMQSDPALLGLTSEMLNYTTIGNISPAFAPVQLNYVPSSRPLSGSSFLEVPLTQAGFSYGTQSWGAAPSPGFPPAAFSAEMDAAYDYDDGTMAAAGMDDSFLHHGFVTPAPIWT